MYVTVYQNFLWPHIFSFSFESIYKSYFLNGELVTSLLSSNNVISVSSPEKINDKYTIRYIPNPYTYYQSEMNDIYSYFQQVF